MRYAHALGLMTMLAAAACGSDTAADGSALCDATTKGFLTCGSLAAEHTCQPGQYCSDETFGTCSNGCLGDVNCGCNQECVIGSGESVGTCRNKVASPQPTPTPTPTPTPSPTVAPTGCGDGRCTDAELTTCAVDCQPLVERCREVCRSYDFFSCLGPGELQSCFDLVGAATAAKLEQFYNCGATSAVSCDPCTQFLR